MKNAIIFLLLLALGCNQQPATVIPQWIPYDESEEVAINANHESIRMRFKLIQSQILDKNEIWDVVSPQIRDFSEEDYQALKPFILEQDIPSIQSKIQSGALSYEKLTQWYLYRIAKFENDPDLFLNAIITMNPNAVSEARKRDKNISTKDHPIFGMPILLKDNINTEGMTTSAGAHVLRNNMAPDAFIVERLKDKGAIIIGKANLSEWANFLFLGGPNGFSAVGGQTLNPYGRKIFDTGGSSSGSGAGMAANYAAAAIGTETSGSILSPSCKNSIIGLKPTTGLLSRTGIVPLSSTFDTPGPMTRNVMDNAILLSAMSGEDTTDIATRNNPKNIKYWEDIKSGSLQGLRFGVNKELMSDSIYKLTVQKIESLGGIAIEYEHPQIISEGFSNLLRADMDIDLAAYVDRYLPKNFQYQTVSDIVEYNMGDTLVRIPYGQARLEAILSEDLDQEERTQLGNMLRTEGVKFFEKPMKENNLDAVLSINNMNARNAAMANYPCLTIPMGYSNTGEPYGLTFMARPFEEDKLLKMAYAFEQATMIRENPENYK
jgi:amidase